MDSNDVPDGPMRGSIHFLKGEYLREDEDSCRVTSTMSINTRLRENLSMRELSKLAGCTEFSVSQFEACSRPCPPKLERFILENIKKHRQEGTLYVRRHLKGTVGYKASMANAAAARKKAERLQKAQEGLQKPLGDTQEGLGCNSANTGRKLYMRAYMRNEARNGSKALWELKHGLGV